MNTNLQKRAQSLMVMADSILPPPPPPEPEFTRELTQEMLEAEPDFLEADRLLEDRLRVLETDPEAPQDSLKRFLYWGIWRDPELLPVLEAWGHVWERAALRNGCDPLDVDAWMMDVTGSTPESWRRHLAFEARRRHEIATNTCGCCRDGQTRCRCREF